MIISKLVAALAVSAVAAGALAPAASAADQAFQFNVNPNGAKASAGMTGTAHWNLYESSYVEVVRGGEVIARSETEDAQWGPYGGVRVPSLLVGDAVRLIADGMELTSGTYDGLPTINACVGRSSVTGTRRATSSRSTGRRRRLRRSG